MPHAVPVQEQFPDLLVWQALRLDRLERLERLESELRMGTRWMQRRMW